MKNKYDIQQQTTTTELEVLDLGQAHTEWDQSFLDDIYFQGIKYMKSCKSLIKIVQNFFFLFSFFSQKVYESFYTID